MSDINNMTDEILEVVKENDIKFIRLSFCDILGRQKNISILSDGLKSAFENGVSFDAHAVSGFCDVTSSDLFLFPAPKTLSVLPWRPGPGRVARFYCDIKTPGGEEFLHDGRGILKRAVKRAKSMGLDCKIGAECEFYLFKTDENGEPDFTAPFDNGGYLDIAPLDRGEDIRREICLTLEEMGIIPETSHHEQGPGQNEIGFMFDGAVSSADNLQTFKSVVRNISARNGLFASFMPRPIPNAPGSGMHVNLSVFKDGANIFKGNDGLHSETAHSFIAGILSKTPETTLFLNPLANSYERFGRFEAPRYVSWSHQNRSQLVRIPAVNENDRFRMELRSPDPSLNPYLSFALIISAGLDGIENKTQLPPPLNADLFNAPETLTKNLVSLPDSLDKAIELAENSGFIKNVLGEELLSKYLEIKRAEAEDFANYENKDIFYKERYFKII